MKTQIGLLQNQVQSLKQIVEIMEKEAARSDDQMVIGQNERREKLVERWRKEVFDGLMRNKRYELLVKDNLNRYNKDIQRL